MERAQSLEGRAGLLELHRLADDVRDLEPALDLGGYSCCRTDLPDMTRGLSSLDRPQRRTFYTRIGDFHTHGGY
jgi:hypothetical protein